jgi:hypothetical protein
MRQYICVSTLILGMAALSGCSEHTLQPLSQDSIGVAAAPVSIKGNDTTKAGPALPVSGGANQTGVVIPTNGSVANRIANGLENSVVMTKGNFSTALTQVSTNLPKVTDITKASGFDQVELLVYAACADLTTGGTPLMKSKYNVDPAATVTANQAALVAAGMRMLDQHTAALASQGPASGQLTTILTNLVQAEVTAASTSKIAFMSVCIAANTAGSAMLGQ